MIYVIGDSHAKANFGNIPECTVIENSLTIHRFISLNELDHFKEGVLLPYNISTDDILVYIFGELDCRWSIGNFSKTYELPINFIIFELVMRYLKEILINHSIYKPKYSIVCSVTPPSNYYKDGRFGTIEDRVIITKRLNQVLEVYSQLLDIKFLDLYDYLSHGDGTVRYELTSDYVHVKSEYTGPISIRLLKLIGAYGLQTTEAEVNTI